MGIIELIKSLMPDIKLPENVTINLNFLSGNKIRSDNVIIQRETGNENEMSFDLVLDNATSTQRKSIAQTIGGLSPGASVLNEPTREKFSLVREGHPETYQSTVNFFRGKVSGEDIRVLEMASIIRDLMDRQKPIGDLRNDIQSMYGIRGRNISLLFTAGYFESLLIPFYEELVAQGNETDFGRMYNRVIDDYHFAVFVGINKNLGETKKEIIEKINRSREIESGIINIHGIGKSNINAIKRCLDDPEIKKELRGEPEFEIKGITFRAAIRF